MAKKSPPLPPNPKEGGYDYRLDVSQGDKGGERFWGAEIIKPSKKLSFERDIRVQEFQKDRSSSEVRKIVLSPDCKERAPDPPLDGPDSSRVLEYKPRQSHPRRKKKSRSIKRKKIKKKKSKKKKRNLSEAERIGNITGAASPPGQSTSPATVESTTAPPALGARKGPPPGQPVSDMAMNTDKTNGSPRLTTKRRGRSKKGQKRKKKRRSGSEHHGATSPPSPNGQAQADTAAAGSPSVSGADSTLPVAAGSWSPEIWTRKKKNKKGKRRKKRRHSLSPSPPTGEGKAEQSRKAQLQQYLLEQADERQRYQRAEEMEKAYEKEQKETLRKVRLEGQATKLEERQLSLQPEHDAKGETSPRLEEKPKANGMGQNAPQSSMSQREQNVLLQHDKKVENEPQIEKKSLADAFKQAQDSEAHLQHQLDEVQLEREELLKCIKENTDTYKQFETEHHQRGIETEPQRPSEELRRIGGQWNQSRRLANRVLVRRKTVTTLCAPPKFQRARDAEIASLPSRNTSIGRTVILGDDNHVRHGGIGSGKYAVIQETSVAKAIYPQPERGLAKAPPIVTVLDTSGSQDANFRSGRFLFDTTLKTNRGKSFGAQTTPILEMPPEDVIHPIANGLENRIDTFHMNNREYNKNHSSNKFEDELSEDILPEIPPSRYSKTPGPETVVEAIQDCLQAMEGVVRTVASSTDNETAYLRSLRAIEDRNRGVENPTDRANGKGLSSACQLMESIKQCVGNVMNRHLSNVQAFAFCTGDPLLSDVEGAEKENRKKKKYRKKKRKHMKRKKRKAQSGETEWEMKSKGEKNTFENNNESQNDRKQEKKTTAESRTDESTFTPASVPSPYTSSKDLYGKQFGAPGRQWSYPSASDASFSKWLPAQNGSQSGETKLEMKKSKGKKKKKKKKKKLKNHNKSKNDGEREKTTTTESTTNGSTFTPASIPSPYTSSEELNGKTFGAPGRQWSYSSAPDASCSKCSAPKRTASSCSICQGISKYPVIVETSITMEKPHKQNHWLDSYDGRPGVRARTDSRRQLPPSSSLRSQRLVHPTHSYHNVTPHPRCPISTYEPPAMYKWPYVTFQPRGSLLPLPGPMKFTIMKSHARMQPPVLAVAPHISFAHGQQVGVHLNVAPPHSSLAIKQQPLTIQNQRTSTTAPLYTGSAPQLGNYQSNANPAGTTTTSSGSQDQSSISSSLVPSTNSGTTPLYFDDTLSINAFIAPYTVLTRQFGHRNIGLTVFLVFGIVICANTLFGYRDHSHSSTRKLIPAEEQGIIMQGPWLFNISSITSPLVAHAYKLCHTQDCKKEANRLMRVLASGPCHNFYDFVCSRRWASHRFPANARNAEEAAIQGIQDGIWKQIGKAENNTCAAVAIWEACMDTLAIGIEGAAPFRDALKASGLAGWPFFTAPLELDPWCVAGNLIRLFDLAALFRISVEHSVSERFLIRLGNGYTLLSLRDFGNNVSVTAFLRRVEGAIRFLAPEVKQTSILAAEVLNVALHLIKLQAPNNGTPTFKVDISIKHFLQAAFKDIINLSRESIRITFESPRYAKEVEQMVIVIAPRTVLNYLGFYLVQHLWTFSPHDAAETLPNGWRERKCLHMAERAVPSQVLEIGLHVYKKQINFTHFSTLADEMKRRLIRSIAFLPWMDHEMKAVLIENLNRIRVQFILPKQVHSNCSTPSEDSPPHLQSSSAVTVYQRAMEERFASSILRIVRGGDADQPRSVFSSQIEVDAEGNLYVPLAAAASALRQRDMSPYVALMRETGFMVRLAKALLQAIFGRINNYQAAWTPSAHAHYLRVQACFQKHFPTLRDPLTGVVVRKPTSAAEGDVIEHVAVALAHIEFRRAVQRFQDNFSDYRLAGAEKLSTEQLFFISYADSACQAYDDERDFRFFLSSGESPSRQRVNVVLLYDATFHRAFRCRRGHAMVPSRNCSFW